MLALFYKREDYGSANWLSCKHQVIQRIKELFMTLQGPNQPGKTPLCLSFG